MRRFLAFVLFGGILLVPFVTNANTLYFEFDPDFGQSLFIASARQPVEQIFLPLNDHLSAFDVWVSNNNTSSDVTFELFNPSNTLVSTVTRSFGPTPDTTTGTRFGIDLPSQIATVANEPYRIRISTSDPSFRLYYSTQQSILAHNAKPQAVYTGGLVRIGGDDREFAFKSALYETVESTKPVLSNFDAMVISVDQVRLTFNASEPVDAQVTYGPQGQSADGFVAYTGQYTSCAEGVQLCSISLPILHPSTDHELTLVVRDVWGNSAEVSGVFTSAGISIAPSPTATPANAPTPVPTPDTVAPTISNARAVNVSHNSAGIAWTTDEAANSLVVIQFGINKITAGGGSDSTPEFEHLITIPGLAQQTTYTATIRSGDIAGNETTTEFSFATNPAPTPGPGTPSPSESTTPIPTISVGPSGSGTDSGQQAEWSEPDDGPPVNGYRVDIIGEDGQLLDSIYTTGTTADLGDIPDGARVIVYADRGDGIFEKIAAPIEIKKGRPFAETLLLKLPLLLLILGGAVIGGALLNKKRHRVKIEEERAPQTAEGSDQFTSHH